MDYDNSTELTEQIGQDVPDAEAQSGGQAGAVAPSQSSTADAGASQESVVGSYHNPDFDLVDTDGGEADGEAGGKAAPHPDGAGQGGKTDQPGKNVPMAGAQAPGGTQTREENAAYRAMRLRAQRDAEAAAAARLDEQIAAMTGLKNPYTNKPFGSLKEVEEYNARVLRAEREKRAKETGRPVEELEEEAANRAFLTAMRREAERQVAEVRQQKTEGAEIPRDGTADFVGRDLADFIAKYPEFDDEKKLGELENNVRFLRFCGSRFGREPLAELYGAYLELVGNAGAAAIAKAASRSTRSTGSGTGGGVVLTPSQKTELDRWNAEHPEMAMTAKEFLER